MTGDERKAQAAFQDTIREAASHSAEGEPPNDRLWFFREARWRCLAAGEHGLQPEEFEMEETSVASEAPSQLQQLEPVRRELLASSVRPASWSILDE